MYTWGDIKEVILAKIDLDEDEAGIQNLVGRFPYFADEAITQICSAVKPKHTYYEVQVTQDNINSLVVMPDDFISFGDDVNKLRYEEHGCTYVREAHDCDFEYLGYNQLLFKRTGTFYISYNARWIDTFAGLDANDKLNLPRDILDCIPSYVASQCMKIDDEYKSSVYRNEYEMFLARIDDTDYKSTKTFTIEGDW